MRTSPKYRNLSFNDVNLEKNIHLFRLLKGISIEELEQISKVSHHTFSSHLNFKSIQRIADALDVSPKDLFLGVPLEVENMLFDANNIGYNLKKLFELKQITQKQVAQLADLSISTVYKMANGKKVRMTSLKLVADVLDVSIKDIITGNFSKETSDVILTDSFKN